MKNSLKPRAVLGESNKENVENPLDKKKAPITKGKPVASKAWNGSTRMSPLHKKRAALANKENAGKTKSQASAGSKPQPRGTGALSKSSASMGRTTSQSATSASTLEQQVPLGSAASSQGIMSQHEALSPLRPVQEFQFPVASQIASLQPAVSPSAHAPQAHAASVQRPAVMRAHAVPGTPMTPPAAATAVSPLLSPGIKLTPPECKAMIDAVELAIHDLATAQTPGGVDLQDSFPAWLERAGIPSDIGSAARQQLRVLYDRAREGSRLLEQFKSNELDMAQMESEENERFISFLADENAELQTVKTTLSQDNELLRSQLEALRTQLQELQHQQSQAPQAAAPIALLRDPELFITDRRGPLAPSPGLRHTLTPNITHATAWASEPSIPAEGLALSPVVTPSLHEAVAWVIGENVPPMVQGGSTPVTVGSISQAALATDTLQPAVKSTPQAKLAAAAETPAVAADQGAPPAAAPSTSISDVPAGSEGSRFSLSVLSSSPTHIPFADWAVAAAVRASGSVPVGGSTALASPGDGSVHMPQKADSPSHSQAVSQGGFSELTTPGFGSFGYHATADGTVTQGSPASSQLTCPGQLHCEPEYKHSPCNLENSLALAGFDVEPAFGSPAMSAATSAAPQCSNLSALSSTPVHVPFADWATPGAASAAGSAAADGEIPLATSHNSVHLAQHAGSPGDRPTASTGGLSTLTTPGAGGAAYHATPGTVMQGSLGNIMLDFPGNFKISTPGTECEVLQATPALHSTAFSKLTTPGDFESYKQQPANLQACAAAAGSGNGCPSASPAISGFSAAPSTGPQCSELSTLSSTPMHLPFADWTAAGAADSATADCTASLATPGSDMALKAQHADTHGDSPAASLGGLSSLTTPGAGGVLYHATPGTVGQATPGSIKVTTSGTECGAFQATLALHSTAFSNLTTPGDYESYKQQPADLQAHVAAAGSGDRCNAVSPAISGFSAAHSTGPQCSEISMLSSTPEAVQFTQWAAQITHPSPGASADHAAGQQVQDTPATDAASEFQPSSPTPASTLCSVLSILSSTPAAVPYGQWAALGLGTSTPEAAATSPLAAGGMPAASPAFSIASTLSPVSTSGAVYGAARRTDGTPIGGGMLLNALALNATPDLGSIPRTPFNLGLDEHDASPLPQHVKNWGLQCGDATPASTTTAASLFPGDSDFTFGHIGQPFTPGVTSAPTAPVASPTGWVLPASPLPAASEPAASATADSADDMQAAETEPALFQPTPMAVNAPADSPFTSFQPTAAASPFDAASPMVTLGSVAPTPAGSAPVVWQHAHLLLDDDEAASSPDAFATPLDAFGVQATPGSDAAFYTGRSAMPTTSASMQRTAASMRAAPSAIKFRGSAAHLFGTPLAAGLSALAAVPEASHEEHHATSEPSEGHGDSASRLSSPGDTVKLEAVAEEPPSPSAPVPEHQVQAPQEAELDTPLPSSLGHEAISPAQPPNTGMASSCASCGPASPAGAAGFPGFLSPADQLDRVAWTANPTSTGSPDAAPWPADCASAYAARSAAGASEHLDGSPAPVAAASGDGHVKPKVSSMMYEQPESIFARVARSPSDVPASGGRLAHELGLEASQSASLMAQSISGSTGSVCSGMSGQRRHVRLPQPVMLSTPCAHPDETDNGTSPMSGMSPEAEAISATSVVHGADGVACEQLWAITVPPVAPLSPCGSPARSLDALALQSVSIGASVNASAVQHPDEVQPFDGAQSDSAMSTPPKQRTSCGMAWTQPDPPADAVLGVALPDGTKVEIDASPLSARRSVQALCSPAASAARSSGTAAASGAAANALSPGDSGASSSLFGSTQSSDVCELLFGADAKVPTSQGTHGTLGSQGAVGAADQHSPTPVNSPCAAYSGINAFQLTVHANAHASEEAGAEQQPSDEADQDGFGAWVGVEQPSAPVCEEQEPPVACQLHSPLSAARASSMQLNARDSPSPTPFSSPAISVKSAASGLPVSGVSGMLGGMAKPQAPSIRPSPTPCSSPSQGAPSGGYWRGSTGSPAASWASGGVSHGSVSSSVTKTVPAPADIECADAVHEAGDSIFSAEHLSHSFLAQNAADGTPLRSEGIWGSVSDTPDASQLAQLFVLLQEEPTPVSGLHACTPLNTPLVRRTATSDGDNVAAPVADAATEDIFEAAARAAIPTPLRSGNISCMEAGPAVPADAATASPPTGSPDASHEKDQQSSGQVTDTLEPKQQLCASTAVSLNPSAASSAAPSPMPSIYAGVRTPMTDSLYNGITTPQSTLSALMPRDEQEGAAAPAHTISELRGAAAAPSVAASPPSASKAARGHASKPLFMWHMKTMAGACPPSPATRGSAGSVTSSLFTATATSSFWAPSENSLFPSAAPGAPGAGPKVTVHAAGGKSITANQDVLLDARGSPARAVAIGTAAGGSTGAVGSSGSQGAHGGMKHSWRDIYVVPANPMPKLQIAKAQGVHLASPPPPHAAPAAVANTVWPNFGFDHPADGDVVGAHKPAPQPQPQAAAYQPTATQRILMYSTDVQTTPGLQRLAADAAVGSGGSTGTAQPAVKSHDGAVQTTPGLATFVPEHATPEDFTFAAACPLHDTCSTSTADLVLGGSEGSNFHTAGAADILGDSVGASLGAEGTIMNVQEAGPGKARKPRGRTWRVALTDSTEKEVRRRATALAVRVSPYFRRGAAGNSSTGSVGAAGGSAGSVGKKDL